MKTLLSLLSFTLLCSISGYTQTKIKEGTRQDTIVKTEKIEKITRTTSSGTKTTYRNISQREGKWSIEASYGMAFGNQTTYNFVPQVSYSQSPYFSVGGGLSYSYFYLSDNKNIEKMNYLGLNIYARINPLPFLTFQVQPEILERWGKQDGHKVAGRIVPTFLAGGGFVIPAGPGDVNILFLFDIIQNKYTPYGSNLYYTIGYSFRL